MFECFVLTIYIVLVKIVIWSVDFQPLTVQEANGAIFEPNLLPLILTSDGHRILKI
jgi:hypothetical protein